jgi:acetyltransferase
LTTKTTKSETETTTETTTAAAAEEKKFSKLSELSKLSSSSSVAEELKAKLFPGSSVANPIDFLATGTAEQLGTIIDYCEQKFDQIDAIAVIYGTPGLTQLYEAYDVLDKKIRECKKPIFPVLPSLHTAGPEVAEFLAKGHVNFSDEVTLATALSQVMNTPPPALPEVQLYGIDIPRLHKIIYRETNRLKFEGLERGYVAPDVVRELLSCAGIPLVPETVSTSKEELTAFAERVGYPVVAKVVGPIHKSDVGGVALNIRTAEHLALEFDRMMKIEEATSVMVQKMLKGTELFIGAKYEERFGHVVLCGLGGIFVEVLKDVSSGLAPLSYAEAYSMIHSLRGYKILKGTRGQEGINEQKYAEIIVRLSTLLRFATEIKEIDLNPLLADENSVVAVDARILIER